MQPFVVAHVVPQHTGSEHAPVVAHPNGVVYTHGPELMQCEVAATNDIPVAPPALRHSALSIRVVTSDGNPLVAHTCQLLAHASAGAAQATLPPHMAAVRVARKLSAPIHVAAQPAIVGYVT